MFKKIQLILAFSICSAAFAQTTNIKFKVESNSDGTITYKFLEISDTNFFQFYYYCSLDHGIKLKDSLANGTYSVFHNDTIQYTGSYKSGKKSGTWYYYFRGTLVRSENYKNGRQHGKAIKKEPE
jgi:antitoxin component YwqK of YwqJK toxin-antitoxin module